MAEITKISSPLVPKENVGNRFKPDTDQAFDINKLDKTHRLANEGRLLEPRPEHQALRDSMGRAAIASVLKDAGDMSAVIKRLVLLVETGVSAADAMKDPEVRQMLNSVYINPDDLMSFLKEQDQSSVLFKGEVFDVLRDLLSRFPDNPKIRDAVANLLKAFECNVNTPGAIRTILTNCANILDYLFSQDRQQFSSYLDGLAEAILPKFKGEAQQPGQPQMPGQPGQTEQTEQPRQPAQPPSAEQADRPAPQDRPGQPAQPSPHQSPEQGAREAAPPMAPKEVAQLLKGNLLPLLGEIVIKYNQNEKIRDYVMVAVHNTVRVDQGTPEALRSAINKLLRELRQVANLPEDFTRNLTNTVMLSSREAKQDGNQIMERFIDIINQTLRSQESSPATIRQAETFLMSMLQNESPLMDLLHYVIPIQFGADRMIAELFIDPDNGGDNDKENGKDCRKLFLCFESQVHGSYEVSILQRGDHIDFAMWCPTHLVKGLGGMKRLVSNIMQTHGFTLSSYSVDEFREPHSVAEVFPDLLNRRVGIDIRI